MHGEQKKNGVGVLENDHSVSPRTWCDVYFSRYALIT